MDLPRTDSTDRRALSSAPLNFEPNRQPECNIPLVLLWRHASLEACGLIDVRLTYTDRPRTRFSTSTSLRKFSERRKTALVQETPEPSRAHNCRQQLRWCLMQTRRTGMHYTGTPPKESEPPAKQQPCVTYRHLVHTRYHRCQACPSVLL